MKLAIDFRSKLPVYAQIEDQVRSLVAAGKLRPGDPLPSIRNLASDLGVNYNTIARVYLDLDRDGVIKTYRGRGTYVADVDDERTLTRMRQEKLQAIVRSALDKARTLGYRSEEVSAAFEDQLTNW